MGQTHENFREFRTPFPPRDIRKNPRSMYARVPQAMAQFVLKIEHGDNPNTRIGARLRSLSPIMAPGIYYMAVSHEDWELPNSRIRLAEIDIARGLDIPI